MSWINGSKLGFSSCELERKGREELALKQAAQNPTPP
jgi:hypothetical protein